MNGHVPPRRRRLKCHWDAILSALADGYTFSIRLTWDRMHEATAWKGDIWLVENRATLFEALMAVLREAIGNDEWFTRYGCDTCRKSSAIKSQSRVFPDVLSNAVAILSATRNLTFRMSGSRYAASTIVQCCRETKRTDALDTAIRGLAEAVRVESQKGGCRPASYGSSSSLTEALTGFTGRSIIVGSSGKRMYTSQGEMSMIARAARSSMDLWGLPLAGSLQEGYLAAVTAVDKFQGKYQDEFWPVLIDEVYGRLADTQRESTEWTAIQNAVRNRVADIDSARQEFCVRMHRPPSLRELAMVAEEPARVVLDLLNVRTYSSLFCDSLCRHIEDVANPRVLAFQNGADLVDRLARLRVAYREQLPPVLGILSERHRKLIIYSEGLDGEYEHTLEELAFIFQTTHGRVSRSLLGVKKKLKAAIEEGYSA